MLNSQFVAAAFQPYWEDMQKCRDSKAYWALLHVTVCIPDICAALESADGVTKDRKPYIAWCENYLSNPAISGKERYFMRCRVLHQGRTETDGKGRYRSFAFRQPSEEGAIDHLRVAGDTLHLDVGELAREAQVGVDRWTQALVAQSDSSKGADKAAAVERNLTHMVRVTRTNLTDQSGRFPPPTVLKTSSG